MEDQAMSLIRKGYAVSTRGGSLGALFSALLALALLDPGAAIAQEVKQIKLTEKHIQGFMAAYDHIAMLYDGANPDKPDPKLEAQAGAIAKKSGFASLAEYEDASMNIAMIMYGIDPQTKKFTEPSEQIKKEIAALKVDKSVPEAEKREGLVQLEAALKDAKPVQFKENIALVLKYFDKLASIMQEQDLKLRPAD
jgi:hypothetical protein